MICSNCEHEHDGSIGICPACGVTCTVVEDLEPKDIQLHEKKKKRGGK